MDQITVGDVELGAAWLVEKGCKAAPVKAASHSGIVYTQPGEETARFAQAGDTLVWTGAQIVAAP